MSKRNMPWPAVGARVEVTWVGEDSGWEHWTFHGARRGWVCLMPFEVQWSKHEGAGRLHWFPASAVVCMVEAGE